MTKPIQYTVQTPGIDALTHQYGSSLQDLDLHDRNALVLTLASYCYLNAIPIYKLHSGIDLKVSAASAIPEDDDVTTDAFTSILDTLADLTPDHAKGLILALSDY